MIEKEIHNLNLVQIADSGQCFRWKKIDNSVYSIVAFGKYLEVGQHDIRFTFNCSEEEFENIWCSYFDLDKDYGSIKTITEPDDKYLQKAIEFGSGIRILKQELWETLISFIISQNNNIPRIKKSIEELCIKYGEEKEGIHGIYHAFPTADCLSKLNLDELRRLGVGYRDQYLLEAATWWLQFSAKKEELFVDNGYSQAAEKLCKIKGVGKKVADCVCLYGLHFLDSFPIDTHIKRIFKDHYPQGFPFERYKNNLGIIQQYMFYYDLTKHHKNSSTS